VHKAHEKLVEASRKGARFLLGGPDFVDHASLGPALIEGVTKEMSIWDEETFGPSASVFIADTENEAICIANDSKYGLNAAIHTMNFQKAIELGRRLEVAQVHVNAMTEHDERECLQCVSSVALFLTCF
jgi:acyl-CoA reductase-like NAD-dependent aldehyde dehydrogenase